MSHARWVQQQQEEEESRKLRDEIQRKLKDVKIDVRNQTEKIPPEAPPAPTQTTPATEKSEQTATQVLLVDVALCFLFSDSGAVYQAAEVRWSQEGLCI